MNSNAMKNSVGVMIVVAGAIMSQLLPANQIVHNVSIANTDFSLSQSQVFAATTKALDGSGDAAIDLVNYYFFVKHDQNQVIRWAIIGAENGSIQAEGWAYRSLRFSSNVDEQRRSLFWLKRASLHGDPDSIAVFKICSSLDSKWNDKSPCFGPHPNQ